MGSKDARNPEPNRPDLVSRGTIEELSTIARRVAAMVKHPYLDHADFLYDERGLPK
jgi:hypothetical protein